MKDTVEDESAAREQPVDVSDLFSVVYGELKRLASFQMVPERQDHTLTPTALLHEAYVRLVSDEKSTVPRSRIHFFAAAAEAMRRVLIEHARKHNRRNDILRTRVLPELGSQPLVLNENIDLMEVDEALTRLAALHPQRAELVTLRYYGGLTLPEVAEVLEISLATANRHWALARAWLSRELIENA